jgi:hypothetical protein
MNRTTVTERGIKPAASRGVPGCQAQVLCGTKCGQKCGILCGTGFRTQGRPRPRQHWVFARQPSPTTRPPRRKRMGEVRVVGLGQTCNSVQAGAGPARNGSVRRGQQNSDQLMDGQEPKTEGGRVWGDSLGSGDQTGGNRGVTWLREVRIWVDD